MFSIAFSDFLLSVNFYISTLLEMSRVWKPTLDISELHSSPLFICHRTNVLSEGIRQKIKLSLIWQPKQINLKKKNLANKIANFEWKFIEIKIRISSLLTSTFRKDPYDNDSETNENNWGGRAHYTRVNSLKPQGVVRITQLSHMNVVLKKKKKTLWGFFFLFHVFLTGFAISHPGQRPLRKWTKKLICFFFISVQN